MFSFNMFNHLIPRVFQNRFSTQYRCFSVSMLAGPNDRSDVEKGGKIIMLPSALDQLKSLSIPGIASLSTCPPTLKQALEKLGHQR
uniref:Ubiquitin fusion degradation protein UFD1 N-terminal subdomain 1 domain-containing protein n=1 Tax=Gorilla gorilla gorilla TaxID=9595 RepID=A0A2I2ZJB7_GORGO